MALTAKSRKPSNVEEQTRGLNWDADSPVKILHIVENLDRGAVETWLVQMFEECHGLRPADQWTFYCTLGRPGRNDERVKALGGRIIYSPVPLGQPASFFLAFRQMLKQGHFDILHCHHDLLSGCYLLAAMGLRIQTRIVHIHNTDEALPTPSPFKHWLLKEPLRQACLRLSDKTVGISRHALGTFLKKDEPRTGRDQVLYYGCDFGECFQEGLDPVQLRSDLGLPAHTRLVLFLGRLSPTKNPIGALDIFAALYRRRTDIACLFAGDGDLSESIVRRAAELGLSDRVRMLGWYEEPLPLMKACDLFLFPRLEHNTEGFGVAVLEAQAAGLPVLTSLGVSDEVVMFPKHCRRLPVAEGAEAWAAAADSLLRTPRLQARDIAVALQNTPFSREAGARNLLTLYDASTEKEARRGIALGEA